MIYRPQNIESAELPAPKGIVELPVAKKDSESNREAIELETLKAPDSHASYPCPRAPKVRKVARNTLMRS